MDFNTLAELQAELQAAENERTLLLKQVATTPLGESDGESYSDDGDNGPIPDRSSTAPPPPLPPSAPRKVLNWGVGAPSSHCSKQGHLHAGHTPQAITQRNTPCKAGSEVNPGKEVGSRACKRVGEESNEGSPGSGSLVRAQAPASDSDDAAPPSASTAECNKKVATSAGSTKHHGYGGAKGGDTSNLWANGVANGGGATGGWLDEEAVRRSVLREVLAVMLGPQAAHKVDCYQLDVQTIAAVAQQRPSNAPSSSNNTGVPAQRLAKEQADKAAALEARSRAEKELAACKSMLDQERTQAKRKLDASRREAEGQIKEKRDLMARLGQQGRDARAAASALQEIQGRVASLEQQVCAQQRAAAAAQRSLEQARSEHKAGLGAMEVALAAAKQEAHAAKEEGKKEGERIAEAATHEAARALKEADAEVEELRDLLRSMQVEVEQQQQQQAAREQLAELRQVVAQLRPGLNSELAELNLIVGSSVADLEARHHRLALQCNERMSALLQLDAQIAALGTEGVDKLHREVREAQQQQAHAEQESRQQVIKLAGCEAQRSKLAMEKQVQATELAMLVQQQAELKRGLSAANNALSKSKADVAQLTGRATHLAQQLQQANERAGQLETAADAAKERAAHAQQQAQEAVAQQEACQLECDALREQAEHAQKQAAAGFAHGVQQASVSAAAHVKALRDKYFQASLIASPPFLHHHHQQQQQQQQQHHLLQEGSAALDSGADQHASNDSNGANVSPGEDGCCAQRASAIHSDTGKARDGGGSADGCPSQGKGPSLIQVSQSLAASAACEDAFGLKLCRLSHEGLMEAFQEYSKRQGQIDIATLMQQHHDHQSSSAAEWGAGVRLELLWLEGCLLLALVEGRQAQQQQQQQQGLRPKEVGDAQAGWEEDGGQEGVMAKKRTAQAPMEGGTHKQGVLEGNAAKELVGQMMRAMAHDRKLLQQRVHQLEAQASPHSSRISPPNPHTFAVPNTLLPARRVLSAQTSSPLLPSSVLQQQQHQQLPRMHSASAATGRRSIAASLTTVAGVPVAAELAAAPRQGHLSAVPASPSVSSHFSASGVRGLPMGDLEGSSTSGPAAAWQPAPMPATATSPRLDASGTRGLATGGTGTASPPPSATQAQAAATAPLSHRSASGVRGLPMGDLEGSSTSGPAAAWQQPQDTCRDKAHSEVNQRDEADEEFSRGDDYDDVWNVLEALEESNLRSSRGMHGLHSIAARSENAMVGKRVLESRGSSRGGTRGMGVFAPGPSQALGFQPRAQLSRGQAFVAKYREVGRGERGRGKKSG